MNDRLLFTNIKAVIAAGLPAAGFDAEVVQSYQPTQQGVSKGIVILINKVPGDIRYGHPQKKDEWDGAQMVHTERQFYESTFQVNALAPQDPMKPELPTASDVLNRVAAILQSDAAIAAFKQNSLAVLRVRDVRNTPFIDDKDRNEFSPSFDFTLTHEQVIISTSPVVEKFESGIYPV